MLTLYIINDNILTIKINKKLNNLENEEILDLFCTVSAFNMLEIKTGNEYNSAIIKIKYKKDMIITEHINIFKIVRTPFIYEFLKYFKKIEERFGQQANDTKSNINDYLEEVENISQEIIINMVFQIRTNLIELNEKKKNILFMIKLNNVDQDIFAAIGN